ncbi:MAG: phosphate starvation-inducible protein PhoH, partial [Clostridia bacterium]|nr:phosphate starvation-inducible protein PhoH [Clostridia bacterium]
MRISNRSGDGNSITVSGDEENIAPAVKTLKYLQKTALAGEDVTEQVTMYAISMCRDGLDAELSALDDSVVCITAKGKPIKAKTVGQKKYIELIR